jgi:hypothetical protein
VREAIPKFICDVTKVPCFAECVYEENDQMLVRVKEYEKGRFTVILVKCRLKISFFKN